MTALRHPWATLDYDLLAHPFPAVVADSLGVHDLTGLDDDLPLRTWETDQDTPWHAAFYAGFDTWRWLYDRFVREVIAPEMSEPFYYQAVPTFRLHLPGNLAVGAIHTDAVYNHPPGEVTFWVPLTGASGTASVWIEGDDGEMYAPSVWPGQVVRFSAVERRHGNKINATGRSRASFDLRALPVRLLPAVEGPPTKHTRLRFVPGSYYAPEAVTP